MNEPADPSWELRLGDCLDPETGLASLADRSVDHVIADPPYEAEAHTLQRRVRRGNKAIAYEPISFEPISFEPISFEVRSEAARQIARVTRRWAVLFCQSEAAMIWKDALGEHGMNYRRTCVWIKPDGLPQFSGDRPGIGYESVLTAHQPGRSRWNGGGRPGVWIVNKIGPYDRNRTGHQTQKPLALMEALIRDFTDPGELVCDPFAGSGTTGVACVRLGRRFVGWELDPGYHAIAVRRLSAAREQLGLWDGAA